jgi:hypothetical protein
MSAKNLISALSEEVIARHALMTWSQTPDASGEM